MNDQSPRLSIVGGFTLAAKGARRHLEDPAVLLSLAFVAASTFALDRIPYFGADEVWPASTAHTLITTGRFARDITSGSLGTQVFDAFPPLWPAVLAIVYWVFGISPWTTRVPSIIAAGLAVYLGICVIRRLTSDRLAIWLAGAAWALDPILVQRARLGRMEPLALVFELAATLLLTSTRPIAWPAAGVLSVAAAATYPFAALGPIALTICLSCQRHYRRVAWLNIGVLLGAAVWLAWLWGRTDYFVSQVLGIGAAYLGNALAAPLREWNRYLDVAVAMRGPGALLVYLVAPLTGMAIWPSSSPSVRVFLGIELLGFVLLSFVNMKFPSYTLFLSPYAYAALAGGIASSRGVRVVARYAAGIGVVGGLLVFAGMWGRVINEWSCRDPVAFESQIRRYIPDGSAVIGPGRLWLPTIHAGGRFRVLMDGRGPQSDPFQSSFLENRASMLRYDYVVIGDKQSSLETDYPEFRWLLAHSEPVASLVSPCSSSAFQVTVHYIRAAQPTDGLGDHAE